MNYGAGVGLKIRRKARADWLALMPHAHEGYVSWEKAEAIRTMVSSNVPTSRLHGAPKRDDALLAGLIRCRRCGRKLTLGYSGTKHQIPRYSCSRGWIQPTAPSDNMMPQIRPTGSSRESCKRDGTRRSHMWRKSRARSRRMMRPGPPLRSIRPRSPCWLRTSRPSGPRRAVAEEWPRKIFHFWSNTATTAALDVPSEPPTLFGFQERCGSPQPYADDQ